MQMQQILVSLIFDLQVFHFEKILKETRVATKEVCVSLFTFEILVVV